MSRGFKTPKSEYGRIVLDLCLRGSYRDAAMQVLNHHVEAKRRFQAQNHDVDPSECSEFDQVDAEMTEIVADLVRACVAEIDRRIDDEGPSIVFQDFRELRTDPLEIAEELIDAESQERRRLTFLLTAAAEPEMW